MNEHNRNDYGLKNLSSYLHAASKLKKNGNILANSNSTHSLIRNKSGNKYYNIKDHSNYNTTINDYFNMNISREGDSYEVSLNEARFDKQDKLGASTYNRFKDSSFNNNLRSERNSKHTQASELKPSNKTSIYSKISSMKYRNKPNPKFGKKDNSVIIAYGANTYQGLFRNYNEDRVSIILNVIKPNSRMNDEWPSVSFFAIYDGHGGHECADFLRDNLHHYVRDLFICLDF